jgi:peroxiredoxin
MQKIVLLHVLLAYCFKPAAQQCYRISGSIPDSLNAKYIYIYGLDYSGLNPKIYDSSLITNGQFSFSGKIKTPGLLVSLYMNDIRQFFDQLYIENCNISIIAHPRNNTNTRHIIEIKGSPVAQQYQEWKKATEAPFNLLYPLHMAIDSLEKTGGDPALIRLQKEKVTSLQRRRQKARINFIQTHQGYYISLVQLRYELFSSLKDTPILLGKLYKQLAPKLKTLPEGKGLSNEIRALHSIQVGKQAPCFSATDPQGKTIYLSDYKGKYLLIDFWASWCSPCLKDIPALKTVYSKYHPLGLELLSISLDERKESWMAAIKKYKLNWAHISELKSWNGHITKQYNIHDVPTTILVSPTGKIIAINPDLSKDLSPLLQ